VRWDVSKHPAWSWQRIAFWAVRVTSFGWLIYATAIVRFGSQGGYLWTAQAGSQGPAWGLPGSVLASFGRAFLWAAPLWWLTRKSLEMRIALLALSLLAILHWPSGMVASIVPNELAKVSPFDRFGFIVLCGTLTGDLLLRWNRDGRDLRKWLAGLTVGLLLAALLADPGLRWKFQAGALRYGPLCAGVFTALFWFAWELHRLMPSLGLVAEKPFLALGTNTLLAYLIVKPIVAIQGLAGIKIRDLYLKDVGGWPGFIDPIVWLVVFTAIVVIANRKRLYLRI
jgi:hypothetical protein